MRLLSGKSVSAELYQTMQPVLDYLQSSKLIPRLCILAVGQNDAGLSYIKRKEAIYAELQWYCEVLLLDSASSQDRVLGEIERCNNDPSITAILLQLPLPEHLDLPTLLGAIDPHKDVDGLSPLSQGAIPLLRPRFLPCTPMGILQMLKYYRIPIKDKRVSIVGRSLLVGRPLAQLLSLPTFSPFFHRERRQWQHSLPKEVHRALTELFYFPDSLCNGTVTLCHTQTPGLKTSTQTADVLIVSIGRAHHIKADHIREGVCIIDVGINVRGGRVLGDVDMHSVAPLAAAVTPVPSGVGPLTVSSLVLNSILGVLGNS